MNDSAWVLLCVSFVSGFGWGQWLAERRIRIERRKLEDGRLYVSMPLREDTVETLQLVGELVRKVEKSE